MIHLLSIILMIAMQDVDSTNKRVQKAAEPVTTWEKREDSLRNEVLARRENTILKNSILQEMYIRNVVRVSDGNLFFMIPFNLHAPDCGAPDCYSTDVSFSFKLGSELVFPRKIQFREQEHGCTGPDKYLKGRFQLAEQTDSCIIYHSAGNRRTLVLMRLPEWNRATAYYFTGAGWNKVTTKNISQILGTCDEGDAEEICPFRSWILTANEYEFFLQP